MQLHLSLIAHHRDSGVILLLQCTDHFALCVSMIHTGCNYRLVITANFSTAMPKRYLKRSCPCN